LLALHLLTQTDNTGSPLNKNVQDVIDCMTGTKTPPIGIDLIACII
jgi:hypothetical protein